MQDNLKVTKAEKENRSRLSRTGGTMGSVYDDGTPVAGRDRVVELSVAETIMQSENRWAQMGNARVPKEVRDRCNAYLKNNGVTQAQLIMSMAIAIVTGDITVEALPTARAKYRSFGDCEDYVVSNKLLLYDKEGNLLNPSEFVFDYDAE